MSVVTHSFLDRVGEILHRYSMVRPGDRVGVAVSGGADSVALLHSLHELAPKWNLWLAVLHFNHGWRGAESDRDQALVEELAGRLGLPVVAESGGAAAGNREEKARLARMDFFRRMQQSQGLRRIAVGHSRSDQAETVLFRFLRGAGTTGMAAMRPVTADGRIRPFLFSSREEIRAWALERGLVWREDSSNADTEFSRNRLRLQTMPLLREQFNPNLEVVLAGAAELAADEEDYWAALISPIFRNLARVEDDAVLLPVPGLLAEPLAVRRRIVRMAIQELRGDLLGIDAAHIQAILQICGSSHGHDRVLVPGVDALRSYDLLRLTAPLAEGEPDRGYRFELELNREYLLPFGAGTIRTADAGPNAFDCVTFKEASESGLEEIQLEADPPFIVRNWEPGDRILRPGRQTAEKIKTLFQEEKVYLWERRHWPVVVAGEQIVWARRFGPASRNPSSATGGRRVSLTFMPG